MTAEPTPLFDADDEPEAVEDAAEQQPEPGARAITADLLGRLRRHYIKPGGSMPGGVFLTEVGENGAWGAGSRADALYVGFTSASSRLLVGHEVKASRADWLAELRKPGKADAWADQCHEWWLVTVPGVVAPGELPEGWGLMLPGRSRTRMKVERPAARHPERQPSWDAVRSIMARLDTLQRQEFEALRVKTLTDARAHADAEITQQVEARVSRLGGDTERLATIDRACRDAEVWGFGNDADELSDVVRLYAVKRELDDALRRLTGRYTRTNTEALRSACDDFDCAVAAALHGQEVPSR